MGEPFDQVREETRYQLEQDQYAAYLCVYIDDDGHADGHLARDGNRLPPNMSRQEAAIALLMTAVHRIAPDLTLEELIAQAGGVEYEHTEMGGLADDDLFEE